MYAWPWLWNDLALALASNKLSSNISLRLSGTSKGIVEEKTSEWECPTYGNINRIQPSLYHSRFRAVLKLFKFELNALSIFDFPCGRKICLVNVAQSS